MTSPDMYEVAVLRSTDDETAFFGVMGRFFASAAVRRECGGYPLNDGIHYRWFVLRRRTSSRIFGFISLEHDLDALRIRHGYLRPEVRGRGLFRLLRDRVLEHVDAHGLPCSTRVLTTDGRFFEAIGFEPQKHRGRWIYMVRKAHARSDRPDGQSQRAVRRIGSIAASAEDRRPQSDPTAPA